MSSSKQIGHSIVHMSLASNFGSTTRTWPSSSLTAAAAAAAPSGASATRRRTSS
eukprot:CAMPEP_0119157850 /NCGR_PEP_ID=MMETSP1310-20130426/52966_1 /TAXON_ID=464262 /ORGANISM="Genus nov. species nov., Strain RCC2339" /LENGTH=53 /DNA_ID=CAMNT_0007150469 /DNA_START=54 /DNA_END=215 /DNA_ORIENTATION=+